MKNYNITVTFANGTLVQRGKAKLAEVVAMIHYYDCVCGCPVSAAIW
jgi:hypothetical protein